MLKAILFDIDNTLLSFDESVKQFMKIGFEKFHIGEYRDDMFSVFTRINNSLWQSIEKGELSFEELQEIRFNKIFESVGLSFDGVIFEKYFREFLFESAIAEDGAVEALEYLNKKYLLFVASNGPYRQQVNRLRKSGMLPFFSNLFISEELGSSKPSSNFFDECMKRINAGKKTRIWPNEVIIIGDSLSSDITGGMRYGMQTCFYNPTNKCVPDSVTVNYQIGALNELKSIL